MKKYDISVHIKEFLFEDNNTNDTIYENKDNQKNNNASGG